MIRNMPLIGLGTWLIKGQDKIDSAIKAALECGYKHIDTAQIYNNEYQIGKALKRFGVNKNDIFITTKIWVRNYRYHTYKSLLQSLKRLQVKYIDLVLLHVNGGNSDNLIAYKELIRARKEGLIKYIGVSNWSIDAIKYIYNNLHEYPYTNQIIISPVNRMKKLEYFCIERDITITAYSTIRPYYNPNTFYDDKFSSLNSKQRLLIDNKCKELNITPSQLILKWALKNNFYIIPKSEKSAHIKNNFDLFSFDLGEELMEKMDDMNKYSYSAFLKSMKEWEKFTHPSDKLCKKGLLFEENYDEEEYRKEQEN